MGKQCTCMGILDISNSIPPKLSPLSPTLPIFIHQPTSSINNLHPPSLFLGNGSTWRTPERRGGRRREEVAGEGRRREEPKAGDAKPGGIRYPRSGGAKPRRPRRKTTTGALPRPCRSQARRPCPTPTPEKMNFPATFPAVFPANSGRPRPRRDHPHEAFKVLFKSEYQPDLTGDQTRRKKHPEVAGRRGRRNQQIWAADFDASGRPAPATSDQAITSKRLILSSTTTQAEEPTQSSPPFAGRSQKSSGDNPIGRRHYRRIPADRSSLRSLHRRGSTPLAEAFHSGSSPEPATAPVAVTGEEKPPALHPF